MNEFLVFFLHGLAYAGLLFLVSAGLTLVFGMMNVLNFAHAAMYMLGAYFSYTIVMQMTGQFWMALMICPVILFVIGAMVERFLLRRVHRYGHVQELLLTFGLLPAAFHEIKHAGDLVDLQCDDGLLVPLGHVHQSRGI